MRIFRTIVFVAVTAAFVAGGIYAYFYIRKVKTPVSEAVNAIPANACFIFESRQAQLMWKKLSETSIMWEDLLGTRFFGKLNRSASFLDSALLTHPKIAGMLRDRSLFLSAHPAGEGQYDYLYLCSLPDVTWQEEVESFVKKLQPGGKETLSCAFSKGIFIASFNPKLVDESLRQLASGGGLMNDKGFTAVQRSAGDKAEASLYINYKSLPEMVAAGFLSPAVQKQFTQLSSFATWTELDITARNNSLMLNGFTACDDSLGAYLSLFAKQKPQEMEMVRILPANTSNFLFFGISNFMGFYRDYLSHLGQRQELANRQNRVAALEEEYHLQLDEQLLSWINNEMAFVITEPADGDLTNSSYAVFRSNNISDAKGKLTQLCDSINRINKLKPDTESYRGHMIELLDLPRVLPLLLGTAFEPMKYSYFTTIGDYVVFGNSMVSLKSFIGHFESGKTLRNSKDFVSFTSNLAGESNLFLYSNVSRSPAVYGTFLNESYLKDLEVYSEVFHKFGGIGIQFSTDEKLFYNNIYIKHDPIYKQESSSVWEAPLDDTVSTKPFLVVNHNTKAREVFVQDNSNKVYLISNTGKILWERRLPEKIMGDVHQVDILKNNKLQLMFNTRSAIYLIDRNGKDYGVFPLKLRSPATSPISVFDYEDNRDYRILLACEDKKIYNFKGSGEPISGWKFGSTKAAVTNPIKHCMVGDKDYIVFVDTEGRIYMTDRQGGARPGTSEKLSGLSGDFFLEAGKDPGKSWVVACDTLGNILKTGFTGGAQSIQLRKFGAPPVFLYVDINNDKTREYVLLGNNQLSAYNQDKSLLYNYEFKSEVAPNAIPFNFGNGKGRVGVVSPATRELLLINESGTLQEGFPLFGNTAFSIGALNNDGELYLITGSDNNIYAYRLR